MDHPPARSYRWGFPPGVLLGLALALVQAILQCLFVPDYGLAFLLPAILLYILVPFCAVLVLASRTGQPRRVRAIGWQSGLTCALLVMFADLILALVAYNVVRASPYGGEPTAGYVLFLDVFGSYVALVLLNGGGIALSFAGAWLGGAIGGRLARPRRAPQMGTFSRRYHPLGWWGYLLFLPLVPLLAGAQLVAETGFGLGLLPEMQAVYAAPPAAFDPYNPTIITLSTWQDQLYEHALPHSYILRASDGSVMRTVATDPFGSYQGILYTSVGQSFPADAQRTIQAIRESDGRLLWSYTFPERTQSIQLVGGTIYFNFLGGEQTGLLGAIDALTGHALWHYTCFASNCYVGPPQVSNGIVYATTTQGTLLALRASDGSVIWSADQIFPSSPALVSDHQIILQNSATTLAALDPATGHQLWQVALPQGGQSIPQLVSSAENSDLFMVVTADGIGARSLASGALLWQQPLTGNRQQVFLMADNVYTVQLLQVQVLRASDGALLWTYTLNKPAPSTSESFNVLGEAQGLLYVQPWIAPINNTDASLLIALRVADGSVAWQRQFRLPTISGVIPAGQSRTMASVARALLMGNTLYFAYQGIVSNSVPLLRFKISMLPVVSAELSRTTFTLAAFALDAQSGNTRWQQQYVESYPVG